MLNEVLRLTQGDLTNVIKEDKSIKIAKSFNAAYCKFKHAVISMNEAINNLSIAYQRIAGKNSKDGENSQTKRNNEAFYDGYKGEVHE